MTRRSQKPKLKLNSIKVIRAPGLLRIYEKLLKNRTPKNEETCKTYKNLPETFEKRSKKKFYSEKLQKFKSDARKTWSVMKEILHHKILNSSNKNYCQQN